ncbi:MAG: flagellar filament capping protein FliD, partial [Phycisphaerae bacterium]
MSGISTGVGLISGIDTAALIDQLIAIDSRPIDLLQQRSASIDAQKTALLTISAQLLAIQNSVSNLNTPSFFRRFAAQSSNSSIINATPGESAAPGSYTFSVRSLVSSHSLLSRGFADSNSTPVGTGTLSIEVGDGQVNRSTTLDSLKAGEGIRRGVITIFDKEGNSADIDLRSAVTIDDVLEAINSNTSIEVRASVTGVDANGASGDRIVIEDITGSTTGALKVLDANGGHLAEDLGIAGTAIGDGTRIDGNDLVYLGDGVLLSQLNDGNGIDRLFDGGDLLFESASGNYDFSVSLSSVLASRLDLKLEQLNNGNGVRLGKFRITDRAGNAGVIDLGDESRPAVKTVQDVIDRINEDASAAGVNVNATVVNAGLFISDNTGLSGDEIPELLIEDIPDDNGNVGFAAADLGIAGSFDDNVVTSHDLYRMETVGDLVRAINFANGNFGVEASISENGNSISIKTNGDESYTIRAGEGSNAARDLGLDDVEIGGFSEIESRTLVAGLNTVLLQSLNGGSGVTTGSIRLTDRSGNSTGDIDLSTARTLKDVIDLINQSVPTDAGGTATLRAEVSGGGTGIVIRDLTGDNGVLRIEDVSGSLAADLGIATTGVESDVVQSGNLQKQYVSRQTLLSDLNGGAGINLGSFQITDSAGFTYTIDLASNLQTVGEVIDEINSASGDTTNARINDQGDGILIEDSSDGELALTIADGTNSTAAADLRLAGTAGEGQSFIDGSYEYKINITAGDTLNDVTRKINEAGGSFSAAIVNDGGAVNPASLTLTSGLTGTRGQLVINSDGIDLGLNTLSRASDAVVAIGGDDAVNPILVSSGSNTLENVIEGVTLDLLSVGDEPVTVDVSQDLDSVVEAFRTFVSAYNETQSQIDDLTAVDPETFERAALQGDRTVNQIRNRLNRAINTPVNGVAGDFQRFFQVGIRIVADNRLEFDEER